MNNFMDTLSDGPFFAVFIEKIKTVFPEETRLNRIHADTAAQIIKQIRPIHLKSLGRA